MRLITASYFGKIAQIISVKKRKTFRLLLDYCGIFATMWLKKLKVIVDGIQKKSP